MSTTDKPQEAAPPRPAREPSRSRRSRRGQEEIAASQRRRLLDSMASLCATRGYHATTIGEIVATAGVSRATYYELFDSKEDCFVAALDESLDRLRAAVLPAVEQEDKPWAELVHDGIRALLAFVAAEPAHAHIAIVEPLAAGKRSFERYDTAVTSLLERVWALPPATEGLPSATPRVVLGGAEWLIAGEMIAGRTERVPELLPDVVYIALLPFVGQAEALRQMSALTAS